MLNVKNININKKNGITLISLVITIIILIILAGVSIYLILGENGIITKASYAKFVTEVMSIHEQVELSKLDKDSINYGTINDVLKISSDYNDILYVDYGELVYIPEKVTNTEKEWLEQIGIKPISDYFTVDFETLGGTQIPSQKVKAGKKVVKPDNPYKEGYEFDGWYYTKEVGSGDNLSYQEVKFDFDTEILSNYSLYAKYAEEAVIINRNNNTAFWKEEYRTKISKIYFKKEENINVPENAIEQWNVNQSGTSEIIAYIVDDGNSGFELNVISKYEIIAPAYLARFFNDFTNLESIDLSNFNTSRVVNMFYLFADSSNLKNVNVELLKTNNTKNMNSMFLNCSGLQEINLSNFDTSKVEYMNSMFQGCTGLEKLQLSSFNTGNVINMIGMFRECSNIQTLDLSNFNTDNVTDMQFMFYGNTNLKNINLTSFNTSNVTNMRSMFNSCSNLEKIDLTNFVTSNVTNMQDMFSKSGLKELDISNFNTEKVTSMFRMFESCEYLERINFSNCNNSNLVTIEKMFYNCFNLKEVILQNFTTNMVNSMTNMFSGCSSIQQLDLTSFDTSNVTTMVSMFYNCENMQKILVGEKWNIENVTSKANMFLNCGVKDVSYE